VAAVFLPNRNRDSPCAARCGNDASHVAIIGHATPKPRCVRSQRRLPSASTIASHACHGRGHVERWIAPLVMVDVQWRGWMHRQAVRASCEAGDAEANGPGSRGKASAIHPSKAFRQRWWAAKTGKRSRRNDDADGLGRQPLR